MHLEVERLDRAPGGAGRVIVRAHGRLREERDVSDVVVTIGGRSFGLVPLDEEPAAPEGAGSPVSVALIVSPAAAVALARLPQPRPAPHLTVVEPPSGRRRARAARPSAVALDEIARRELA